MIKEIGFITKLLFNIYGTVFVMGLRRLGNNIKKYDKNSSICDIYLIFY